MTDAYSARVPKEPRTAMLDRPRALDMQPTLCSMAKRVALEHFGVRLDQSARSVRHVDKILAALRKEHLQNHSADGFEGVALEFAAYIVAVVQRHFGPASWERDCTHEGVDAFPLHWRGATLYPYSWCLQRIYGGDLDVWSTFRLSVLSKARPWWKLW